MSRIKIIEYNENQLRLFAGERVVTDETPDQKVLEIHRGGSTLLPGRPKKPDVDILSDVANFERCIV